MPTIGRRLPHRRGLERFSNWYSLTYFIEGDFFLRKKPLSLLASVYSYWRTALVVIFEAQMRDQILAFDVAQGVFPQLFHKNLDSLPEQGVQMVYGVWGSVEESLNMWGLEPNS